MILTAPADCDDIRFVCYCVAEQAEFRTEDCTVRLEHAGAVHEGVEAVAKALFLAAQEDAAPQRIAAFTRARMAPAVGAIGTDVVGLLNYINLVRDMIATGTLRHREALAALTPRLPRPFLPEFYLAELRAGRITHIAPLEGTERIFCERVEIEGERTVCSGLREHYAAEKLAGRTFLFVANAKPARVGGATSEGMICCVSEGTRVEALAVDAAPGARIALEGLPVLFEKLPRGTVDLRKPALRAVLAGFAVRDHFLEFEGRRVLCGGAPVRTECAAGPMS